VIENGEKPMSLFPLDRFLDRFVTHGELTVIGPEGERRSFGKAGASPAVTVRITDPSLVRRMVQRPGLMVGEGYVDGGYVIEQGTLADLFDIAVLSARGRDAIGALASMASRTVSFFQRNDRAAAQRNVQHHYDIDHTLYEMFLDEDMQYSCAYWRDGVTSLDQAQWDKKEHIARKLLLKPGMKVLDIGSGWGGMALHLARQYGVEVTGVTLSEDQYQTSVRRAEEAGLGDRVTFKLQDYRAEQAGYDRIVSVGMFEHVGQQHFNEFFRHLNRLLKPDGVSLIHTIGRQAPPAPINPWMKKYIFPGAYLPSLSQLAPILERRDLWLTDFEMLRMHYAKTLAAWNERFQARRAEIAARFDERFCRMWEFYLQLNVAAFTYRSLVVFQMQITRQNDVVPITRDYMYAPPAAAAATIGDAGRSTSTQRRKRTVASGKRATQSKERTTGNAKKTGDTVPPGE
jgi:cyclopropane-fatty-acyl-phospholipid synthase